MNSISLKEASARWGVSERRISQLANERVKTVTDVVKEGDEVSVKVIGFDRGKVKLSIKEAS